MAGLVLHVGAQDNDAVLLGLAYHRDDAEHQVRPLFVCGSHCLVENLVGDVGDGIFAKDPLYVAPHVHELVLLRLAFPQRGVIVHETERTQDMEIEYDLETAGETSVDGLVDERHGALVQGHVLVEELDFVDGEADVVEAVGDQQVHVLLGEYLLPSLTHDPALGEPVADVHALVDVELRRLVPGATGQEQNRQGK